MDVEQHTDAAAAGIAAAIGEPARARMLYCLVDNRARTSTELAVVADVSPSTASIHLSRLKAERLVKVVVQGRHRYYSLNGAGVARVLEGLSVLAGGDRAKFVPNTPNRLRAGRTCYDHIAGALGVSLHDRFMALEWLAVNSSADNSYEITPKGTRALEALDVDIEAARMLRRRFAFACLDWSERRFHLGGALGAALLNLALKRRWVSQDLDSRALAATGSGRREMMKYFGLQVCAI
jgi:DNA-binding transcriptional ArsR family regulator